MANVREVRTVSHLSEEDDWFKNIIPRRAPALPPLSLDIGPPVIRSHLLRVAIEAAIGRINMSSTGDHPGWWKRIDIGSLLVALRFETADLQIRNHGHAKPGEGEDAKNPKKEWLQTLHTATSAFSF